MNDIINDFYKDELSKKGFVISPHDPAFCALGTTWQLSDQIGSGRYWIYHHQDMFDIKIHDFYLHEDSILTFDMPECLSITKYESISGEELTPYRRLEAGAVQTFIGGRQPYKILIHKKIPIRSVGIEIMPAYYKQYLKEKYGLDYENPAESFMAVDKTFNFPEMSHLLSQVMIYRGEGMSAKLFYESKVAEAVGMIVDYSKMQKDCQEKLSSFDIKQLETITSYLNDHYAHHTSLDQLSKIACMSKTKLQSSFKKYHHLTITEYLQQRRMSQAEFMLANTDIPIYQIAASVGYHKASRFTELFKKSTGLLPNAYRKIVRNKKRDN